MATVKLSEAEIKQRFLQFTGKFYQNSRILEESLEKSLKLLVRQARFKCLLCTSKKNLVFDNLNLNRNGNTGILTYVKCLNCKRYFVVYEDGIITKSMNY